MVLRESLDTVLHHPLPWDIELVIDRPNQRPRFVRKFNCSLVTLLRTHTYLAVVSQVPVEGRDTHMRERETDRQREREKKRKKERQRDPS